MSVNILVEPQDIQPVYNNVITVAESTNSALDKFKYLFEVYDIDGAAVIASAYVSPHFSGMHGVYDAHRVLENLTSLDIAHWDNTTNFTHITNNYFNYRIDVTESYVNELSFAGFANSGGFMLLTWANHNLTTGDLVTITNTVNHNGTFEVAVVDPTTIGVNVPYAGTESGDIVRANNEVTLMLNTTTPTTSVKVFNGVVDWFDSPNFDSSDYELDLFVAGTLITENTIDMGTYKRADYAFVNVWNNANNLSTRLFITTNNGTYYIVNAFDTTASGFVSVGVGVANLENAALPIIVTGSLPMIDDDTTDVSFYIADGSNTATSKTYSYKVNQVCSKYPDTSFLFMDKFGALDGITFDLVNSKTININKEHFNKNFGAFDSSAVSWGYNSYDKGKSVLNADKKEVFKVQSNYMDQVNGRKVLAMIESPETFINESGTLKAIDILTASLKEKTKLNDKLISYEISYEYANVNDNQRG